MERDVEVVEVVDLEEELLDIVDEQPRIVAITTLTVAQSLKMNAAASALKSACKGEERG